MVSEASDATFSGTDTPIPDICLDVLNPSFFIFLFNQPILSLLVHNTVHIHMIYNASRVKKNAKSYDGVAASYKRHFVCRT